MADSQRKTANLWGETSTTNRYIDNQGSTGTNPNGDVYSLKTFTVSPSTTYTFSWSGFTVGNDNNLPYIRICFYTSNGGTFISRTLVNPNDYLNKYVSFTIPNNCTYVDIRIDSEASTRGQHFYNIMLNTGSTAKSYEPYGWLHSLRKLTTSTDTITTLPAVLYPNDTTATVGLKGNTVQNGTPTPASPVDVQGVGTLDNGQYKIPISSASTTTPVYLGEVQTTRRIKKLVLTGEESWSISSDTYYIAVSNYYRMYDIGSHLSVCSHYPNIQLPVLSEMHYGLGGIIDGKIYTRWNGNIVFNPSPMISSLTDWRTFLAQQYAAGTPVTIWYVLAEPTTGIVNEPLMKIGDYADTLSNVSIPVTAGGDTLSVGTTVQPSEATVNYHGWHPADVHERDNGAWT